MINSESISKLYSKVHDKLFKTLWVEHDDPFMNPACGSVFSSTLVFSAFVYFFLFLLAPKASSHLSSSSPSSRANRRLTRSQTVSHWGSETKSKLWKTFTNRIEEFRKESMQRNFTCKNLWRRDGFSKKRVLKRSVLVIKRRLGSIPFRGLALFNALFWAHSVSHQKRYSYEEVIKNWNRKKQDIETNNSFTSVFSA